MWSIDIVASFVLIPILSSDECRIILTWGSSTYVVPQNETGIVWPVFSLSKDGLHSANEAFYSASASEVR